jgi:hypothetical protein
MNIDAFAALHHLKTRKAGQEQIIPGRLGQVFDYGAGMFGIFLEDSSGGPSRARTLLSRRKAAQKVGFRLIQEAECESVLLFNPADGVQAKIAVRLVGARKKRTVRMKLASLRNLRKTPTQRGPQDIGSTLTGKVAQMPSEIGLGL